SHFLEFEGVVHLALAEIHVVAKRRQMDVRRDPVDLGAISVGPVELLNGQLECAVVLAIIAANVIAYLNNALNRTLAERARVSNDQSTVVVLDHSREDLRGASAQLVDQNDQRPIPGSPFIVVGQRPDTEDLLNLHDGSGVDE